MVMPKFKYSICGDHENNILALFCLYNIEYIFTVTFYDTINSIKYFRRG